MILPCVYQMSEDGVYPLSVPSCPFKGMKSSKQGRSRFNIGRISLALCSIGFIHGVVQVIQNCYMGIQNLSQISRLV